MNFLEIIFIKKKMLFFFVDQFVNLFSGNILSSTVKFHLAGRIWPVGRSSYTPDLKYMKKEELAWRNRFSSIIILPGSKEERLEEKKTFVNTACTRPNYTIFVLGFGCRDVNFSYVFMFQKFVRFWK